MARGPWPHSYPGSSDWLEELYWVPPATTLPPHAHTHKEGDLSHRSRAPRAQALQEEEVWAYPGFGEVFTSPSPSPLGGQAPLAHKGAPGPAPLWDPSSPSANTPGPSLSARGSGFLWTPPLDTGRGISPLCSPRMKWSDAHEGPGQSGCPPASPQTDARAVPSTQLSHDRGSLVPCSVTEWWPPLRVGALLLATPAPQTKDITVL